MDRERERARGIGRGKRGKEEMKNRQRQRQREKDRVRTECVTEALFCTIDAIARLPEVKLTAFIAFKGGKSQSHVNSKHFKVPSVDPCRFQDQTGLIRQGLKIHDKSSC